MSETNKSDKKFPTAVVITLIICATILLLTIAGMIFGGVMANKVIKNLPDKMPDNVTIRFK